MAVVNIREVCPGVSLESVLAGWIVLGELLKPKEIMGCVLVFTAVILAQIPGMKKGDTE